jgi:hypothetical protein
MKFLFSKLKAINGYTDADKKGKVGGGRLELLQFSKVFLAR